MKIYLASSWKNQYYNDMLEILKKEFPNTEIYNFQDANWAFNFKDIPEFNQNTLANYKLCKTNPYFVKAFENDYVALFESDIVILILPSGKSSHLEMGFAVGMDKTTILYNPIQEPYEFDLMHNMIDYLSETKIDLIDILKQEGCK